MSQKERTNYTRYYLTGNGLKKWERQVERSKRGELKPWAKKAKKIIKRVVCISAAIVIGVSVANEVKGSVEAKNHIKESQVQTLMQNTAMTEAYKMDKTSDSVIVMQKYAPYFVDYLAESLRELGVSPRDGKERTNAEFVGDFFDYTSNAMKERKGEGYDCVRVLKEATELTIQKTLYDLIVNSDIPKYNQSLPKSYHDIEFFTQGSYNDNAVITYYCETEMGTRRFYISDSYDGIDYKMPNNLLELICDIKGSRSITDYNEFERFVSDIEKLAIDTKCYGRDETSGRIKLKVHNDVDRISNTAHNEIRNKRAEIILKEMNKDDYMDYVEIE